MTRDTAQQIDQAATDWAAKVDRGLTSEEQAQLDDWLDGDIRRVGAYGRMRAVALQTERVAALAPSLRTTGQMRADATRLSRRRMLAGGVGVAASVSALGVTGWAWLMQGRHRTRKGETRQLALPDGSVVTLNTDSEARVHLTAERREVHLLTGEALFDVARDEARPFIVHAHDTRAQVLGTSFVVKALPGQAVEVLVREGSVEVSRKASRRAPAVLKANDLAVSPTKARRANVSDLVVTTVSAVDVGRALAWRDGQIDFEGVALGRAAAEFARYSDTRVVVDAPLAQEEIAGLYQVNDPVGFAKTVALTLRAKTQITDGEVRIYQSVS